MAVYKRGDTWWYSFIFAGKRIQESAKTSRKTIAVEAENNRRRELEKTLAGMPAENRNDRIRSVSDVVKTYLEHYDLNHRNQTVLFARGRLAHVKKHLGAILLPDLTENVILRYIKTRLGEKVSGRTINMELGELSRAIGRPWSLLWPKVGKMEERKDVGRALAPEEEKALLQAANRNDSPNRSAVLEPILRIALLTGMRSGEIVSLTWGLIDFSKRVVTVGRAKTASGTGRQIPMNQDLFNLLSGHAAWFNGKFGATRPSLYLFPFGRPTPNDPTRPVTTLKTAWNSLRLSAGVDCRFHDLRHTAVTKLAEAGTPEATVLALVGHMSKAMMERYSHIRMKAKRQAVDALSINQKPAESPGPVSTISTTMRNSETIQ